MKLAIERTNLLAIAATLLMAPGVHAQHQTHPVERTHSMERMRTELGLSDEQVARMNVIREDFAPRREAIQNIADADERRQALKEHAMARRAAIDAVLTPEQREKADALRAEKREQAIAERKARNADPATRVAMRTERLTSELELSVEQVEQVRGILAQHMTKKERAAELPDEAARKQTLNELRAAEHKALMAVLTTAQQERWKALQAERKAKAAQRKGEGASE